MDRIKRTIGASPIAGRVAGTGRATLAAGSAAARDRLAAGAWSSLDRIAARFSPDDLQRLLGSVFGGMDPATRAQVEQRFREAGYDLPAGKSADALSLAAVAMAVMRGARGGPGGIAALLLVMAGGRAASTALLKRAVNMTGPAGPAGTPSASTTARAAGQPRLSPRDLAEIARSPLARQVFQQIEAALRARRR